MVTKDTGFVLKRHNFRETSLLVTLYTLHFGKIRGILKGFYTSKKEFSSPLEVGSLNEFVFYPRKNEVWLIAHSDLVQEYPYLRSDLAKARAASVIVNCIERAMQLWDPNEYIFSLADASLKALLHEKEAKVLAIFLVKFLTLSGFKPELDHCIVCSKALASEHVFSVARGGFVCRACNASDTRRLMPQTSRSLSYIQNADIPAALRLSVSRSCEEEIFYILKEFIAYHFEFDLLGRFWSYNKNG